MRASPAWWLEAETQKSHSAGVQLLPPPLSSNMTLDVVFKLSVPWFPHLSNRVVGEVKQINTCKAFKGIRVTQLIEKSPTSSHFLLRIFFFPFAIETGTTADTGCSRILRACQAHHLESCGIKTPDSAARVLEDHLCRTI